MMKNNAYNILMKKYEKYIFDMEEKCLLIKSELITNYHRLVWAWKSLVYRGLINKNLDDLRS